MEVASSWPMMAAALYYAVPRLYRDVAALVLIVRNRCRDFAWGRFQVVHDPGMSRGRVWRPEAQALAMLAVTCAKQLLPNAAGPLTRARHALYGCESSSTRHRLHLRVGRLADLAMFLTDARFSS